MQSSLLDVLHEEEDMVIPTPSLSSSKRSTPSSKKSSSSRRGTFESLLSPLTNFIDLRDDESSGRGWRSFVEFSA